MVELRSNPFAQARDWHALAPDEVPRALDAAAQGLTSEEAIRRLALAGPNALPEPTRRHPLLRLLAQFNNALIYFLLVAAVAALGWAEALIAVVALAVSAIPEGLPAALADGMMIIALGAAMLLLLEGEKALLRRLGVAELQAATER